jgi:hypothetical protein
MVQRADCPCVRTQALWKGVNPTMVRQGWNQLFLFGTYDLMKKALFGLERDDPIPSWQSTAIGLVAGALGTSLLIVMRAGQQPTALWCAACLCATKKLSLVSHYSASESLSLLLLFTLSLHSLTDSSIHSRTHSLTHSLLGSTAHVLPW